LGRRIYDALAQQQRHRRGDRESVFGEVDDDRACGDEADYPSTHPRQFLYVVSNLHDANGQFEGCSR